MVLLPSAILVRYMKVYPKLAKALSTSTRIWIILKTGTLFSVKKKKKYAFTCSAFKSYSAVHTKTLKRCEYHSFPNKACIFKGSNSPHRSYQRFCHMNETKGSHGIELTLKPLLHLVLNKRLKMYLQAQLR